MTNSVWGIERKKLEGTFREFRRSSWLRLERAKMNVPDDKGISTDTSRVTSPPAEGSVFNFLRDEEIRSFVDQELNGGNVDWLANRLKL